MRDTTLLFCVLLLVHGVFGDADAVKTVSVMEGDSVTLNPDPTDLQGDEEIIWKFGDIIIAKMKETYGIIYTNDVMFRYRLKLDKQNGYLTITNIRTEHAGHFSVDIKKSTEAKLKTFQVTVHGVFSDEEHGVKTVSETKGDSVLLHTHLTHIQQNDPIEWTFGPQNIPVAKTDGISNSISYNYNDESFKNRLYLDIRTGDLTIKKSSAEHSGLYQLKIITSSYTIQKSFSVAVIGSDRSGSVSGISGASVVLMLWAVTVFLLQEV